MCEDQMTLDDWKNGLEIDALPSLGKPKYPLDINGNTLDVGDVIERENADIDSGRFQIVIDLGNDHFITHDPIQQRYFLQYVDYIEQDVGSDDFIHKKHHQNVFDTEMRLGRQ